MERKLLPLQKNLTWKRTLLGWAFEQHNDVYLCSFICDKLQKILNGLFDIFLKLSLCAGLVLQPASEAEEDEVCSARQHPLASALLPHKKSKFSIFRTIFRGRPGKMQKKAKRCPKKVWKILQEINIYCLQGHYQGDIDKNVHFLILSEKKLFSLKLKHKRFGNKKGYFYCSVHNSHCGGNRKLLIPETVCHTFPLLCTQHTWSCVCVIFS